MHGAVKMTLHKRFNTNSIITTSDAKTVHHVIITQTLVKSKFDAKSYKIKNAKNKSRVKLRPRAAILFITLIENRNTSSVIIKDVNCSWLWQIRRICAHATKISNNAANCRHFFADIGFTVGRLF